MQNRTWWHNTESCNVSHYLSMPNFRTIGLVVAETSLIGQCWKYYSQGIQVALTHVQILPPLASTNTNSFTDELSFALMAGVIENPSPSGFFFQIAGKRLRLAPPLHRFIHLFRICCENFRPRSLKVRSPGYVKWPYLIKSLNVCHSYANWMNALKLSAIDTNDSVYKM